MRLLRLQMLAFIQAQPNVVERLLRHIETPAFADMLVRIIQLDELPSCSGVLDVRPFFTRVSLIRAPLTLKHTVAVKRKPNVSSA